MRRPLLLATLFSISATALAAESPVETCEQLRAQIGVPPLAEPGLLRRLAARSQECGFSTADFYKAAYGDRPPARETNRSHRRRHDDDDD